MGHRKTGAMLFALLVSFNVLPAAAQQPAKVWLELPAQELAGTLVAIGQATGANVLFTSQTVAGRRAAALRGHHTLRTALDEALRGSDLRADFSNDGTVSILLRAEK